MTSALAGTLRSAAFGVLAALGVIAWQVAFMAFFGAEATFQVYAVLCACAFPLAIAPSLRAAVGSLAITVPLGFCVLLLAPDAVSTVLAAAFTIGVARVVMFRAVTGRSLLLELVLLVASLAVASALGGGRPLSLALGVWSFFLVQSAYFLCQRSAQRAETAADAFDVAHRRAISLLERNGMP